MGSKRDYRNGQLLRHRNIERNVDSLQLTPEERVSLDARLKQIEEVHRFQLEQFPRYT